MTTNAMPADSFAEMELLGTIMREPEDSMVRIVGDNLVKVNDFADPAHQVVATAIWNLYSSNRPITQMALASWLQAQGTLQIIGGVEFLNSLAGYAGNLTNSAQRIVQKAIRRDIINLGALVQVRAQDEGLSEDAILDQLETEAYNIRRRGGEEIQTIGSVVAPWEKDFNDTLAGRAPYRLKTGVESLDDVLDAIEPNDMMLIGGRPGDGKSTLAKYIMLKTAIDVAPERRRGVYLADFEEGFGKVVLIFVSMITGINSRKLKNALVLTDDEKSRVQRALQILRQAPLFIDSSGGMTVPMYKSRVQRAARMCKVHFGVDLAFHTSDYIQRMYGPGDSKVNQLTNVSNTMRDICQPNHLGLPTLSTAQLNRAVVNPNGSFREPDMSDLRETGALEADASKIVMPVRPWMLNRPSREQVAQFHENLNPDGTLARNYRVEPVKFKVAKNRDGEAGGSSETLLWQKFCYRFVRDERVVGL